MRMSTRRTFSDRLVRLWRRAAREDGFTALAAIATLAITSALATAAFVAADSDTHLTQHDLEQKRAYLAARAGVNEFLHHLNQQTNYWDQCPTKAKTTVPGSTDPTLKYSYQPVPANGESACDTNRPIDTMIDFGTGTFRMRFSGYSGTPEVSRNIVASFRRNSPLDYLWYTVYETLDPNTQSDPVARAQECAKWHRQGRPNECNIDWITGDVMNGSMYTQDQYSVCGSPVFGRDPTDQIASLASTPFFTGCSPSNANIKGTPTKAPYIPLPTYNTQLRDDAAAGAGTIYSGPTVVQLNGPTAKVTNNGVTGAPIDLNLQPIIYVENGPGGCSSTYSPYNVDYTSALSGDCGDVYVTGNYSQGVTIAAANDVVIGDPAGGVRGDITTNLNGPAMLALVANNFVRVMHGCSNDQDDLAYTTKNPVIDAAILALNHSFIVDNYNCGDPSHTGALTINGAIAQNFRGTVGTHSGPTVASGYIKNYTYDDRLHSQEPPYLFDIQDASWHIQRETLCDPNSSDPTVGCTG